LKLVTLSNWNGDQIHRLKHARLDECVREVGPYLNAISSAVSTTRDALVTMPASDVLARVDTLVAIAHALKPQVPCANDEEYRRLAGQSGEMRVAEVLLSQLRPYKGWIFAGYRNRCGEIDFLVVGTWGLLAIEVKHTKAGVVDAREGVWTLSRLSQLGKPIWQELIADHGPRMRSPGQQLDEAAGFLESHLRARNALDQPIKRMVILTNPNTTVRDVADPAVDLVTRLDQLDASSLRFLVPETPEHLNPSRREREAACALLNRRASLIRQHHAWCEANRARIATDMRARLEASPSSP
jgi:hypothetical protein